MILVKAWRNLITPNGSSSDFIKVAAFTNHHILILK